MAANLHQRIREMREMREQSRISGSDDEDSSDSGEGDSDDDFSVQRRGSQNFGDSEPFDGGDQQLRDAPENSQLPHGLRRQQWSSESQEVQSQSPTYPFGPYPPLKIHQYGGQPVCSRFETAPVNSLGLPPSFQSKQQPPYSPPQTKPQYKPQREGEQPPDPQSRPPSTQPQPYVSAAQPTL
jgi:hypothetical protein